LLPAGIHVQRVAVPDASLQVAEREYVVDENRRVAWVRLLLHQLDGVPPHPTCSRTFVGRPVESVTE
jgi:hypothetical protein